MHSLSGQVHCATPPYRPPHLNKSNFFELSHKTRSLFSSVARACQPFTGHDPRPRPWPRPWPGTWPPAMSYSLAYMEGPEIHEYCRHRCPHASALCYISIESKLDTEPISANGIRMRTHARWWGTLVKGQGCRVAINNTISCAQSYNTTIPLSLKKHVCRCLLMGGGLLTLQRFRI